MTRRSAFAPVLGAAVLGTAAVLAAWPEASPGPEPQLPKPRSVRVAAVAASAESRTVRLAGVTQAARRAELSFAVPARLGARPVETGQAVRQGQLVAALDDREYRLAEQAASAALAELDVRLDQARRDLDRARQLAAARAATAEEVEQTSAATAALEAARAAASAQLQETRRLLDEATLRAPFGGTVTRVHLEPGEWAAPGRAVVELAGTGPTEVMVEAPETVRPHLTVGQPVTVRLVLADIEVAGSINRVAAAASGPGRLFPVEVALEDCDQVVPGMAAEVELPLAVEAGLTVPLEAVLNPGSGRPSVYVIAAGRARRVGVELGRVMGDRIAVSGDLQAGDLVAITGHIGLADGDAVEVS